MNTLEKTIELMNLYDVYQELLTDKQKNYFECYYFDDLSLQEISENNSVSRNAVHDQLKRTISKLNDLESKLELYSKSKKQTKILNKIKQINKDEEVQKLLSELEKVE